MKKFLALFVASAITALTIAAPTQPTTPILNGKLLSPLNAAGFRIDNLDTSNLNIPGGGGGTPLTDLTLNVPVTLFTDPVNFVISGGSVSGTLSLATQSAGTVFANTSNSTAAPSWVTLSNFKSAAGLNLVDNTSDASKPISTATATALSDKESISAHDTDIAGVNTSISSKASTTTVNSALALKADITYVDTQDAGKQATWGTPPSNGYIPSGNTDGSLFWVDPVTLGTTSQSFTDGQEFSSTTFDSNNANFVSGDAGKTITGDHIPAGTVIASVTDENTIILSQAATSTSTGNSFTILNRLEVGGNGTVTSVSANSLSPLFTTTVSSPNSSASIAFALANVSGNTFYGRASSLFGAPDYMTAASARSVLSNNNTVGASLLTIVDPNALRYMRIKTDNTIELLTGGQLVTGIGAEPAFGNPASNGQVISSTTAGVRSFVSKENPLSFAPSGIFSRAADTITLAQADGSHDGYLTQGNWTTFNGKENVLSFGSPLSRGTGATANNITISVANGNASPATSGYLLAADWSTFNSKVSGSRTLTATAPLTIDNSSNTAITLGGADRTLAIPASSNTANGYLSSSDHIAFGAQIPVTIPAGAGGTLTVTTPTPPLPPINRILLNSVLTSNLNIVLPPASVYGAGTAFEPVEIFDIIGNAMTTNNKTITITKNAADTSIDGASSIPMPQGSAYLRLSTNGSNKWYSTQYSTNTFQDPVVAAKKVTVNVSNQPGVGTPYVFTLSGAGDSVSTHISDAPTGKFANGIDSNGELKYENVKATDVAVTEFLLGNADIAVTDGGTIDTLKLATAIDATHSYTLPSTTYYSAGERLYFYDATASVTATRPARFIANTSVATDTVNNNATIDVTDQYCVFVADPVGHNWNKSGSSGLGIDTWHAATVSGGIATINCLPGVIENHHTLSMNGGITLVMTGSIPNGATGRIRVTDATGNHTITVPNSVGKTPSANGVGVLTTSTGTQVEDEINWDFDGQFTRFHFVGKDYVAAAPPSFGNSADDTTGLSTTGFQSQGFDTSNKFGRATKLVADGQVTNGATYNVGLVRLRLQKVGNPTQGLRVAFLNHNGAVGGAIAPVPQASGGQTGSASDLVAASSLSSSEGDIDFNPNVNLIGRRNQPTTILTAGSNVIDSSGGSFLPGDINQTMVTVASGTGTIPTNASGTYIIGVSSDGAHATLSQNVATSGTATVSVQHVYWISLYGDNGSSFSSTDYVQWAYHQQAASLGWMSFRGGSNSVWSQTGTAQVNKYKTFKP